MKNFQLSSIVRVITKPNNTFREIFENENNYFKPAIIILILSNFFVLDIPFFSESISDLPINELGYILDVEIQTLDIIFSVLTGFLSIVLIFYFGKIFGGSKNFRGMFSILSYAFIPFLIVGAIVSSFLFYPPLLEYVSGIDSKNSSFVMFFYVLLYGGFFTSTIWSFILSIKAIKIGNNFGTGKSFGVVVLATIVSAVIWASFFQFNTIDHQYFQMYKGV